MEFQIKFVSEDGKSSFSFTDDTLSECLNRVPKRNRQPGDYTLSIIQEGETIYQEENFTL